MVKPILAFSGVCALVALVAWASGYNFDHRGEAVGEALYFTLVLALCAAAAVHVALKE